MIGFSVCLYVAWDARRVSMETMSATKAYLASYSISTGCRYLGDPEYTRWLPYAGASRS